MSEAILCICLKLLIVGRYLQKNSPEIIEGRCRFKELAQYLQDLGLPKSVWLSEDASGIVAKIEYHPSTNQLIGFVLPMDANGIPIPFSYLGRTAEEIENSQTTNV